MHAVLPVGGVRLAVLFFTWILDDEYKALLITLEEQMSQFDSLIVLAFDPDINVRVESSIERARFAGIADERILKNDEEAEMFFTSDAPFNF